MSNTNIYKIIFQNQRSVYEVYARKFFQSSITGFIEIEELIFDTKSGVLVDPSEEKLKNDFAGVTRSYIPSIAIIRIDQVEKQGVAKIHDSAVGNVSRFPTSANTSPSKPTGAS